MIAQKVFRHVAQKSHFGYREKISKLYHLRAMWTILGNEFWFHSIDTIIKIIVIHIFLQVIIGQKSLTFCFGHIPGESGCGGGNRETETNVVIVQRETIHYEENTIEEIEKK